MGKKNPPESNGTTICRCEEISDKEIIELIRQGYTTLNEIKKATRAGMGLCQGKICTVLIQRLLARERGHDPKDLRPPTFRPPVRPLPLGVFREHPMDSPPSEKIKDKPTRKR